MLAKELFIHKLHFPHYSISLIFFFTFTEAQIPHDVVKEAQKSTLSSNG